MAINKQQPQSEMGLEYIDPIKRDQILASLIQKSLQEMKMLSLDEFKRQDPQHSSNEHEVERFIQTLCTSTS